MTSSELRSHWKALSPSSWSPSSSGLWIFGWGRLPKLVHLACIWLVAIGVNASAFFIIAANSFMQHPVGATYNPETGRAELTSIWELLTNNTRSCCLPARGCRRLPDGGDVCCRHQWLVDGAEHAPRQAG